MSVVISTFTSNNKLEKLVLSVFRGEFGHLIDKLISRWEVLHSASLCEKRKTEFLRGRCASKSALAEFSSNCEVKDISITHGTLGEPIVTDESFGVSISHSENIAVALAFKKMFSFGIDVERVNEKFTKALHRVTDVAKEQVPDNIADLTVAWALKEALSKCLKTGFTIAFDNFAFSEFRKVDGIFNCKFTKYSNFLGRAILKHNTVLAIVGERQSMSEIDMIKFYNSL